MIENTFFKRVWLKALGLFSFLWKLFKEMEKYLFNFNFFWPMKIKAFCEIFSFFNVMY